MPLFVVDYVFNENYIYQTAYNYFRPPKVILDWSQSDSTIIEDEEEEVHGGFVDIEDIKDKADESVDNYNN